MAGPGGREVGRVSIRVVPDTSAFGADLEKDLAKFERSLKVTIPAELDTKGIETDARSAANAAERGAKVNLPADVDSKGLTAKVETLVKRLSGQKITINVDLDKGMANARTALTKIGQTISAIAVPVSLAASVPMLLGLASAAVTAAGAVALLPGALGAAAIGITALKVGMSGFGQAMKDMGDAQKFADDLKNLAPSAQQTAIAIRDMGPSFDALKLDVQQQLFEGLGRTITQLGTTYIPILRDGLRQVSAAMGATAQVAGQALMRPESIGAVNMMLDQTAQAFRNLIPAVGGFLTGFLQIGAVGSTFLPNFAQSVTDVANRFAAWSTAAAQSGQLRDIIASALGIFQQLGTIVGNVGSLLVGVFNAIGQSGASVLDGLVQLTGSIAAFVNSAQGATVLQQVFGGLGAAMAGIVPALTQVATTLVTALAPVIAQLGPAIGTLATQLGSVLVGAIQALAPLLLAVATFLSNNMQWIGPLAIGLGAIALALAALGPVIGFVTGLANAFEVVTTVFKVLTTVMLANPFLALAAAVIAIAILVITNWSSIQAFLISAWQAISSTAVAIWGAISGFFAGILGDIVGFFVSTGAAISGAFSSAMTFLSNAASNGLSTVVDFFSGLPGRILGALGALGNLLWSAGGDLIRGMIGGVQAMIGNLLSTVRNLASQAVNAVKGALGIGSPSKVFHQLGAWTGQGFAEGIQNAAPLAITAAADMARAVAGTPTAAPVAPAFAGTAGGSMRDAVAAGVLAGLDGARMQINGDGVAKLVNSTNARNARR